MNELIEKKKEEFEKEFYPDEMLPVLGYENVQSFLETSLKECWEKAQGEERKRIVEGIEKLKKPGYLRQCFEFDSFGKQTPTTKELDFTSEDFAYNKALEEIKSLIIKG